MSKSTPAGRIASGLMNSLGVDHVTHWPAMDEEMAPAEMRVVDIFTKRLCRRHGAGGRVLEDGNERAKARA